MKVTERGTTVGCWFDIQELLNDWDFHDWGGVNIPEQQRDLRKYKKDVRAPWLAVPLSQSSASV